MALSASVARRTVFGNRRVVIADVTVGTYATGGIALAPSLVGLTTIEHVSVGSGNVSTAFYNTVWDRANAKLIVATGAAQASNALDLTTLTVRLEFIGN